MRLHELLRDLTSCYEASRTITKYPNYNEVSRTITRYPEFTRRSQVFTRFHEPSRRIMNIASLLEAKILNYKLKAFHYLKTSYSVTHDLHFTSIRTFTERIDINRFTIASMSARIIDQSEREVIPNVRFLVSLVGKHMFS